MTFKRVSVPSSGVASGVQRLPAFGLIAVAAALVIFIYMTDVLPTLTATTATTTKPTIASAPIVPPPNTSSPTSTTSQHFHQRASKPLASCTGATGSSRMGTRARSFLMVFMSRSGSTAISQTMARHPLIDHKFEFMATERVGKNESARALQLTRSFFQDSISKGRIPGFKIRAFDIMMDPIGWEALAREFDTRIIWQYRKNIFKTTLGVYARVEFGDYTATGGIKTTDLAAVGEDRCKMGVGCTFNITNFDRFHELLTNRITQDLEMVKATKVLDGGMSEQGSRGCVFELPYEDYLYHKEETMKDVYAFLGLELNTLETFRAKATSDSMCDVVENFDEFCSMFYACPHWQPFLDDFENNCRCSRFNHGTDKYCAIHQLSEGIVSSTSTSTDTAV